MRRQKGFTLIEVIVTLVVLVLLAGMTFGGVKGLLAHAEQNARNQVARSLFMAAQSSLTHIYNNDLEQAKQYAGLTVIDLDSIQQSAGGDEWDKELSENSSDIVSLSSDFEAQKAMLLEILDSYVDDRSVLTNHILIEFNKTTGNVLACFYSDEEVSLGHGDGGSYNVYDRREGSLKAARIGCYGVRYTGARAARLPVDEPVNSDVLSVMLVDYDNLNAAQGNDINGGKNYGLLTLECSLPSGAQADTVYEITIDCYVRQGQSESFTLTVGGTGAQIALDDLDSSLRNALESPISYTAGNQSRRAAVFINPQPDADGRTILVLVLDSQQTGAGIRDLYSEISNGVLSASVHAQSLSGSVVYDASSASSEHALYASVGVSSGNQSGKLASAEVASVRHLNNVRYKNTLDTVSGSHDFTFTQTRDVLMMDYNENMQEPFEMVPIYMKAKQANQSDTPFTDIYDGGGYIISGLCVPAGTADAGLFRELGSGGSVKNVYLLNANLSGTSKAGGIAATNNGTIQRCTVYRSLLPYAFNNAAFSTADAVITGRLSGGVAATNNGSIKACTVYCETAVDYGFYIRAAGDDYSGSSAPTGADGVTSGIAGGVAAVNTGSGVITSCFVGTGVRANNIAGGIAGKSSGKLRFCEVCTAMAAKVNSDPGELSGQPYFGDFDSFQSLSSCYYGDPGSGSIDVNQRWIEASGSVQYIRGTYRAVCGVSGGIVGLLRDGTVDYCVNAALVSGPSGVGGGVAGSVYGDGDNEKDRAVLNRCYNAGFVKASAEAGGVAGQAYRASVSQCYNTAPINSDINYSVPAGESVYRILNAAHHTTVAGGIVGRVHLSSSVKYCYSSGCVCGGSNTAYAGAFGVVAENSILYSASVEGCYFLRNCLNVSERYRVGYTASNETLEVRNASLLLGGDKCVTMLAAADLANLTANSGSFGYLYDGSLHVYTDNGGNAIGAGPRFKRNAAMNGRSDYKYPVLSVNVNEYCALLTEFHRTPYYPVLDSFGGWLIAGSVSGGCRVTCYLPKDASVTLRLNWRRAVTMNYYTLNASPRVTGDMGAVGSTTSLSFSDGNGYSFTVSGTVQDLTSAEEWYRAQGCEQKFVFDISNSDIRNRVVGKLYVQMIGSTGSTDPSTAVWCEDYVS